MKKGLKIFIVDDDLDIISLVTTLLESEGHAVSYESSSVDALPRIIKEKPDCILLDIMMPGLDGLSLCQSIRSNEHCADTKIIMVSSKSYEHDQKRAMELGADGFINKMAIGETFLEKLNRIIENKIEMTFWGVRGTLPIPGAKSLKYGGNTSCVTLSFPKGNMFIFDAGTGIKALSDYLLHLHGGKQNIAAKIFISHPHWDHINALPFFTPLYMQGNDFEIIGASHADISMENLISAQMDGVYSPITLKEFAARVYFRDIQESTMSIEGVQVRAMLLNHPGNCLGYRVEHSNKSVCYITDNELYPRDCDLRNERYLNQLIDFIKDTDALIIDTTYTDEEYKTRVNWGHSCVSEVVDLAHRAAVKKIYLFHHDPDQSDADIDAKLAFAQNMLAKLKSKTECVAPTERLVVHI